MKKQLIFILILSLAIVSCKALGDTKPTSPKPELEDLLASLKSRQQTITAVEADGKIEYKKLGKDARHDRGSFTWVVKKPANATFEITGPTGLLAVIGINEQEFKYYDARHQRLYLGPVEPHTLQRVLPWGIMPADLVPLLCASPELIEFNGTAIEFDKKSKRWRLIMHDSINNQIQIFWFNSDLTIYKNQLISQKHIAWTVTYLDWNETGKNKIKFPAYIKLEHPESQTTISLKTHGSPDLNRDIDDSVFNLDFPASIPVEYL